MLPLIAPTIHPILYPHSHGSNSNPTTLCNLDNLIGAVNSATYASLLDSYKSAKFGKQIHAHLLKNGFGGTGDKFVQTKLVQMYAGCSQLHDAAQIFDHMPVRTLYAWIAIINMYLDIGYFEKALLLFQALQSEDVELEFFVFPAAMRICSGYGGLELGGQLHGTVVKNGCVTNIYVANALIDMYGKCGRLEDAKKVFDLTVERDCVSWNTVVTACTVNWMVDKALDFLGKMSAEDGTAPTVVSWSAVIGGFARNGNDEQAIEMLSSMLAAGLKPNSQTLASVLPACARLKKLGLGKEIHGYLVRHGLIYNNFVVNGLVDMYRRCRKMESARILFSIFSEKNEVSYSTMITGYFDNGEILRAEELFDQMKLEGKNGLISWNSMISGYVNNSLFHKSLSLFWDLVGEGIEADNHTLGSVLVAIADMGSLRNGKEVHSYAIMRGIQSDTFVGGALIQMYCKCNDLKAAQQVFYEVTERDTSTWNVLISGYARSEPIESIYCILQKMKEDGFEPSVYTWNGIIAGYVENDHSELALQLFLDMQSSDVRPDIYTIGILLSVCSKLATIDRGMQVHAYAIRRGYDSEAHLGAALLDMYAKCGNLNYSKLVYNMIQNSNLTIENAMLAAYAMHGRGEEGVAFFCQLLLSGFKPDGITFLSALSSCAHAGSVDAGRECYRMMASYDVKPTIKHLTCYVDLLSRAGFLHEAYDTIREMPMETDSVIWGALLGGCVTHENVEIGELAATKLIELDPNNTGNYVMLSNLYASAGRWSDLARTRQLMTKRRMQKNPGCSWIEDRDGIHIFVAHDQSHQRSNAIYEILDLLTFHISAVID